MEYLSNDVEDHPDQHKNSHKLCEETGHTVLSWLKVNGNETTSWSELPNLGKAIVEQLQASEEINKFKKAGLWESQSGVRVGALTIWVRLFEKEKLKESLSGLSVPTRIG